MLKTVGKHILLIGAILMLACMILMSTQIAHPAEKSTSDFYHKNITQSNDRLEINPTFIDNDQSILYLVFSGVPFAPQPWDYKLEKSDKDGLSRLSLSSTGVIDYQVSEDGQKVLLLRSCSDRQIEELQDCDTNSEVKDWEVFELNLQTGEKQQIAAANGRSLSEGYKLLGMKTVIDVSEQYFSKSTQGLNQILVKRWFNENYGFISFQYFKNEGSSKTVFKTEAWKPYAHLNWLPTITWLDETSFVTLGFQGAFDKKLPQSHGFFSIVKIDIRDEGIELLHKDSRIHPFPKMVMAPNGIELFFRKLENRDTTQLWRLNIITKETDLIYSVRGDLGKPRFSKNGSSLVFTELSNNNSEIIRLDLERDNIERIASN